MNGIQEVKGSIPSVSTIEKAREVRVFPTSRAFFILPKIGENRGKFECYCYSRYYSVYIAFVMLRKSSSATS